MLGLWFAMNKTKTHRILAQHERKEGSEPPLSRSTSPEVVEKYLTDESALLKGQAQEVVFPETESQVADVLREANAKRIHVTVSGAGTGITGSRVPPDGIVLSTERMRRVLRQGSSSPTLFKDPVTSTDYELYISKNEKYAIAPAGISIDNLHKAVEKEGMYYPLDPTEKTAFLGGTVATNASGAKTFHYGPTRDWVRRVRVVLPNGDVLDIKRGEVFSNERNEFEIVLTSGERKVLRTPSYKMPNVKNAAGFFAKEEMDLIDLFIGSEGTLGVFTEIEIKLIDKPNQTFDCLAFFSKTSDAIEFCNTARQIAKASGGISEVDLVKPLSLEYFDHCSLDIQRVKATDVPANAKAAILFEQSVSEDKLYDCLAQWNNLFERHHVTASWLPMDQRGKEKLTEFRHSLPEGINSYVRSKGTHKVATDIAVPSERFEEMTNFHEQVGLEMQIKRILDDLGIQYNGKAFESLSLGEKVRLLEEKAGTGPVPSQSPDKGSTVNEQNYELLADRVDAVRRSKGAEVAYAIFGHMGDYHLHFNFLPRSATELDEMKKAAIRLAKKAIELKGTITAEHGVGKKAYREGGVDKPYLEIMYGRQGVESIAAIKHELDPNWILNPGNVVTAEYSKRA